MATDPFLDVASSTDVVLVEDAPDPWAVSVDIDWTAEDETALVDVAVVNVLLTAVLEVVLATSVVERVVGMVTCVTEAAVVDFFELTPSPPVTPGLAVGSVTEAAAELTATGVVVFATVVVAFATEGHSAAIIPPFMTIPNKAFGLTKTFEHPFCTLCCT